jgi:hypothetical protein
MLVWGSIASLHSNGNVGHTIVRWGSLYQSVTLGENNFDSETTLLIQTLHQLPYAR